MSHKGAIKFRRVKIRKKPLPKEKIVFFILVGLIFLCFTILIFNEVNSVNVGRAIFEEQQEDRTAMIRAVIEIDNAGYLDSDRNFISDITNEVKFFDGVWSEPVSDREYVRVTFEQPLDSGSDITIYPRVISGNPRIEVYEKNGNDLIAEFTSLDSNEYNKILLTNLKNSQDSFDLRILGGSIETEHIIDPWEVEK